MPMVSIGMPLDVSKIDKSIAFNHTKCGILVSTINHLQFDKNSDILVKLMFVINSLRLANCNLRIRDIDNNEIRKTNYKL